MAEPITAGIVAGGLTEVTINDQVYTGVAYATIADSMKANTVTAAVGGERTTKLDVGTKTVAVKDMTFSTTSTTTYNGAEVAVGVGGAFIAENSTFAGCTATNSGGAIYNLGDLTLASCAFSGHTAAGGGGGMVRQYDVGAVLTISDGQISNCAAGANGGAVLLERGSGTITGTVFSGNTGKNGGAIFNSGTLTLDGCSFFGNTVSATANAIYSSGALTIKDCVFGENQTIYVNTNTTTLQGTISVGGGIGGGSSGTLCADGAQLVFTNAAAITLKAMTEVNTGLAGATFQNTGLVTFANQDLSGAAISIADGITGAVATKVALTAGQTVSYGEATSTLGSGALTAAKDRVFLVSYSGTTLSAAASDTITIDGAGGSYNTFASYADAAAAYPGYTGSYLVTAATTLSGTVNNAFVNESTITVDGLLTLGTGSISGGAIVVDGDAFASGDTVISGFDAERITGTLSVTGTNYLYTEDGDLKMGAAVAAGIVAGGATQAEINGVVYVGNAYSSITTAMSNNPVTAAVGGERTAQLNVAAKTVAVKDMTISNTSTVYNGAGVGVGTGGNFVAEDTIISGNSATNTGGAIYSTGNVTLIGGELSGNTASSHGGGIRQNSADAALSITGTRISNNTGVNGGGIVIDSGVGTITNAVFSGNTGKNGGAIFNSTSGVTLLDGCSFLGNTAATGNAIYSAGALTIKDCVLGENQTIYVNTNTTTLQGTISVGGTLGGSNNGTLCADGAELIFTNAGDVNVKAMTEVNDGLVGVTFQNTGVVKFAGQDLSGAAITVAGSLYTSGELTIATGVTAIGDYTVSGGNDHLALKKSGTSLILYVKGDVEEGDVLTTFVGGTSNLMTGGTVTGAFFGTANASGDVTTAISGGTIGNAVIGGAKVTKGNTAALDNVTLNISGGELAGGPDNGGQLYTAGYAYGSSESALDANVTLSVAKSELNLTGGSIAAQNLFAGAHARKGARTVVNETVITVTDGTYKRIYGGGWAEKTARSEVGTASITVSGGNVEYIYAGGANALGGTTVTGSATITVSGDAAVDFIFLAGKNANCSVTNDAAVTLSGDAKSLVRISGRNGNGADNTEGVTSLTVATDTTVDYLDYVDKLNLTQGTTLDIVELAQYEHGSDATLNFLTDGSSEAWTALSGAGFELFQSAKFQVNGLDVTRNATTGALGESGYKLDFTDDKFIITKLA